MTNEELSIAIEYLAESSTLLISSRRVAKFCMMANDLRIESISYDELREEFSALVPDSDSDEWDEFLTSVATLVFDNIDDPNNNS